MLVAHGIHFGRAHGIHFGRQDVIRTHREQLRYHFCFKTAKVVVGDYDRGQWQQSLLGKIMANNFQECPFSDVRIRAGRKTWFKELDAVGKNLSKDNTAKGRSGQ